MKMKAKTYGINFLVARNLQLNIFSYNFLLKKLSHIFILILIFVNYMIT